MRQKLNHIIFSVSLIISAVLGVYLFFQRFAHLSSGFSYDELYSLATALPSVPLASV